MTATSQSIDTVYLALQSVFITMKLQKIYRHTVKGLTPEELDTVTLSESFVMPIDRRFAVALVSTPVPNGCLKQAF